jgi:hypothetical protein
VKSGRDPYADVGRATRISIENAIEAGGLNRRAKAFLSALHQTSAFSWLGTRVADDALGAIARLPGDADGRELRRHLRALAQAGALVYRPGRSGMSWIGLHGQAPMKQLPLMTAVADLPPEPGSRVVNLPRGRGGSATDTFLSEKDLRGGTSRLQLQDLEEPVCCVICEELTTFAAHIAGQWWCADHVELAA